MSELDGYVRCSRGFVHRPFKAKCSTVGGCTSDEDCGPDAVCFCDEDSVNVCVPAFCKTDADCGGAMCVASLPTCYSHVPFACESPDDECLGPQDCEHYCDYTPEYGRFCAFCVGRPFLVDGTARVASLATRRDWLGTLEIDVAALAPELRSRLAAAWARTALMEHASVAAFARFSLQLLSVGAPPDLVTDSARAMADEIEHARLAFAAASSYAGEPLGPGPLAVERCLEDGTLREIVILTIREGCVGETIAAAEAAEAARSASDPTIVRLWQTIAEDETRHAELAWRFVRWALENGDAALREAAGAEFAALIAGARPPQPQGEGGEVANEGLPEHGILGARERRAVRAAVLAHVVARCAEKLIDGAAATQAGGAQIWLSTPS